MIEATLEPRKYKIEQKVNEYYYYITWCAENSKWAIEMGSDSFFLTKNHQFDYRAAWDTLYFDTPELALDGWKKYAKDYVDRKEAEKRFSVDYFAEMIDDTPWIDDRDQLDI